jgi:hypothetical protein
LVVIVRDGIAAKWCVVLAACDVAGRDGSVTDVLTNP